MKENEWLVANRPGKMMGFLQSSGPASERKLRLFGCACVRRVWRLLSEQGRAAVTLTESCADGDTPSEQRNLAASAVAEAFYAAVARYDTVLVAAERAAAGVSSDWSSTSSFSPEERRNVDTVLGIAMECVQAASLAGMRDTASLIDPTAIRFYADRGEFLAQAALLRDIFGPLPFRTVAIDPSWLAWQDGVVVRLAQAVYQDRDLPSGRLDSGRLGVLADALQDSGSEDEELLSHLRQQDGFHTLGCWAVDVILGKT